MKQREQARPVERTLPNNHDAEVMVLAALVDMPEHFDDVVDILKPEDFYANRSQMIYESMLSFYREHGEAPDYLTLCSLLEKNEEVRPSDLDDLLADNDHRHVLGDWTQSIRLVLGCSMQRRHIFAAQKLAAIGMDITDPEKSRNAVESLLYDLTMDHAPQSDFESIEDILGPCMNDVEFSTQHRGEITGVPTSYTDLDAMTGGLQKSDFIILAGRPSMGKTALGVNIGYNAAKRKQAVAIFSLEMGKKQLGMRLLSQVSRVSSSRLRSGWIDENEMQRVVDARDHLSDLCIHIDDTSAAPLASIRSKLRRLQAKIHRPIDLVIVDYLQLMEEETEKNSKFENRNQEISKISRGLKAIARDFNVPVLALAQLSRAVESRGSKIPQLSDLRESGSLEQDADIVAFVYRDEYYNPESERKGTADVIIAKHRNGSTGTVSLAFNGALTRFDNLEEVSPDD